MGLTAPWLVSGRSLQRRKLRNEIDDDGGVGQRAEDRCGALVRGWSGVCDWATQQGSSDVMVAAESELPERRARWTELAASVVEQRRRARWWLVSEWVIEIRADCRI